MLYCWWQACPTPCGWADALFSVVKQLVECTSQLKPWRNRNASWFCLSGESLITSCEIKQWGHESLLLNRQKWNAFKLHTSLSDVKHFSGSFHTEVSSEVCLPHNDVNVLLKMTGKRNMNHLKWFSISLSEPKIWFSFGLLLPCWLNMRSLSQTFVRL